MQVKTGWQIAAAAQTAICPRNVLLSDRKLCVHYDMMLWWTRDLPDDRREDQMHHVLYTRFPTHMLLFLVAALLPTGGRRGRR